MNCCYLLSVPTSPMGRKSKGANCLTDSLFFDSDCISAFLWVGNENLLVKLYPGRIVIPGIAHLKARVHTFLSVGQAQVISIDVATEAYDIYYQLTEKPKAGHMVIGKGVGKGEAASIALAKQYDGIVASNNLKVFLIYRSNGS